MNSFSGLPIAEGEALHRRILDVKWRRNHRIRAPQFCGLWCLPGSRQWLPLADGELREEQTRLTEPGPSDYTAVCFPTWSNTARMCSDELRKKSESGGASQLPTGLQEILRTEGPLKDHCGDVVSQILNAGNVIGPMTSFPQQINSRGKGREYFINEEISRHVNKMQCMDPVCVLIWTGYLEKNRFMRKLGKSE